MLLGLIYSFQLIMQIDMVASDKWKRNIKQFQIVFEIKLLSNPVYLGIIILYFKTVENSSRSLAM